jgi:hypothetical protein
VLSDAFIQLTEHFRAARRVTPNSVSPPIHLNRHPGDNFTHMRQAREG